MMCSVPSRHWLIARDRITSSVMTPPALRMMCASPTRSPSSWKTSIRESMHATTANLLAGSVGRSAHEMG